MRGRSIVNEKVAFIVVEIEHLVGEVADDEALLTRPIVVCGINTHCAGCDTTLVIGNSSEHSGFNEGAVAVVLIEFIRLCIVRFKDVKQAVGIVIEDANAEGFACAVLNTCDAGNIEKRAIAAVSEKLAGLTRIGLWGAVRLIRAVEGTEQIVLPGPFDIVRYIEVEVSIRVIIEPRATRAETGVMDTGYLCDVNEGAVTAVLEESVGFKGADIDIWITVVIVIGDGDTHAIERCGEPCGFGDIDEGAVPVVSVECHRLPLLGCLPFPIPPVDEEDILPTVGVIVDESAP